MKTLVRNAKARRVTTDELSKGQNLINAGGKDKRFDVFYSSRFSQFGQSKCRKCQSDYVKFSIDGFCQDCQQKVEFINREYPHVLQSLKSEKSEVKI